MGATLQAVPIPDHGLITYNRRQEIKTGANWGVVRYKLFWELTKLISSLKLHVIDFVLAFFWHFIGKISLDSGNKCRISPPDGIFGGK